MDNVPPLWYLSVYPAKIVHNKIKSTQYPNKRKEYINKIIDDKNNKSLIKK